MKVLGSILICDGLQKAGGGGKAVADLLQLLAGALDVFALGDQCIGKHLVRVCGIRVASLTPARRGLGFEILATLAVVGREVRRIRPIIWVDFTGAVQFDGCLETIQGPNGVSGTD